MVSVSLGCARWLPLAMALAACGNRDETRLIASADEAPVVSPVLPMQGSGDPEPVLTATRDAGVDAGAPQEPGPAGFDDAGAVASTGDAGVIGPPGPPPLPAPICDRLGLEQNEVLTNALILDILPAQENDCRTARLLPGATENAAWGEYLFFYTATLLGCPDAEVTGGLEVFALSNTGVEGVGVPPPPIGSDDAEALIEQYLNALSGPLALTSDERAAFEAYLRYQASKVVDPEVSGALSNCPP